MSAFGALSHSKHGNFWSVSILTESQNVQRKLLLITDSTLALANRFLLLLFSIFPQRPNKGQLEHSIDAHDPAIILIQG